MIFASFPAFLLLLKSLQCCLVVAGFLLSSLWLHPRSGHTAFWLSCFVAVSFTLGLTARCSLFELSSSATLFVVPLPFSVKRLLRLVRLHHRVLQEGLSSLYCVPCVEFLLEF